MFLILLTYKVPIEEVERVTPAHREFLDRAYKANQLLVSGPQVPRKGGVIVSLVKTRDEVDEIIKADPGRNCGLQRLRIPSNEISSSS